MLKAYYRDAMDDMCDYIADKYDGRGSLKFFFRDKDIVIAGKDLSKVSHEDIIDWISDRWKIYLNVRTVITGGEVRFDYWCVFIEKGELVKTPLEHGFETYNSLIEHFCKGAVRVIDRRLKA